MPEQEQPAADSRHQLLPADGDATLREFWEQAKMPVVAMTIGEAKQLARRLINQPLTNLATGITATVSGNSLSKMTSSSAVKKSASHAAHAMAVANLDTLFQRAELGETKADRDRNPDIKTIRRLFAPMLATDGVYAVKITVKELTSQEQGNRLYTVEAMDIAKPDIKRVELGDQSHATSIQYAGFNEKLSQLRSVVNSECGQKTPRLRHCFHRQRLYNSRAL